MDVYRSSGAGGQHVNKTESAVRLTHVPTGIVVACQNERSQHKNRATAMKMLKAKLYELEVNKRNAAAKVLEDSKSDVSWGNQIRSYVLDQSRIKDLRTGVEVGNTTAVLDGDLDQFLEASSEGRVCEHDRHERADATAGRREQADRRAAREARRRCARRGVRRSRTTSGATRSPTELHDRVRRARRPSGSRRTPSACRSAAA